jgi:hypothetical protein
VREAIATADGDFVRQEPRRRPSRKSAKSAGTSWWPGGRRGKPGKHRLALVAGGVLAIAIAGILANALLLQRTRHPAPLLGQPAPAQKPGLARVAPRPQRTEATQPAAVPAPAPERAPLDKPASEPSSAPKPVPPVPIAPQLGKRADPIAQLLRQGAPEPKPIQVFERQPSAPAEKRPPRSVERGPMAPIGTQPATPVPNRSAGAKPEPSRKVAGAQRALVKLGFVLAADGVAGASTRKAVESYERDRGLPPRGVLTPDIVRRLGSEAGVAIE